MDTKAKTIVIGVILIMIGFGGLLLCLFIRGINAQRVPSPTSTTTGIVYNYKPKIVHHNKTSQSATCLVTYTVENERYDIVDTCGGEAFGLGDRLGDEVGVIYSLDNPSKATVDRLWFFNFLGFLGFISLVIGIILTYKAVKMRTFFDEE